MELQACSRSSGKVIARDDAGVVVASQSGHRLSALTAEQDKALATTPADELLALPVLRSREKARTSAPVERDVSLWLSPLTAEIFREKADELGRGVRTLRVRIGAVWASA
jgi:hypothetical protein